jgi:hypothetical protein
MAESIHDVLTRENAIGGDDALKFDEVIDSGLRAKRLQRRCCADRCQGQ